MAPEQLQAKISQAERIRKEIMTAEVRLSGLRLKRDQTERALADRLIGLASSVRGHPDYGSDSPSYRALGFVPDSENRSGRPRKPKPWSQADSIRLPFIHGPRIFSPPAKREAPETPGSALSTREQPMRCESGKRNEPQMNADGH